MVGSVGDPPAIAADADAHCDSRRLLRSALSASLGDRPLMTGSNRFRSKIKKHETALT